MGSTVVLPPCGQQFASDDGIVWHPLSGTHKLPDSGTVKMGGRVPVTPKWEFAAMLVESGCPES